MSPLTFHHYLFWIEWITNFLYILFCYLRYVYNVTQYMLLGKTSFYNKTFCRLILGMLQEPKIRGGVVDKTFSIPSQAPHPPRWLNRKVHTCKNFIADCKFISYKHFSFFHLCCNFHSLFMFGIFNLSKEARTEVWDELFF